MCVSALIFQESHADLSAPRGKLELFGDAHEMCFAATRFTEPRCIMWRGGGSYGDFPMWVKAFFLEKRDCENCVALEI